MLLYVASRLIMRCFLLVLLGRVHIIVYCGLMALKEGSSWARMRSLALFTKNCRLHQAYQLDPGSCQGM